MQESLTNAIRYAPGAAATVTALIAPAVLVDEVDHGPGTLTAGPAAQEAEPPAVLANERTARRLEPGSGPEEASWYAHPCRHPETVRAWSPTTSRWYGRELPR